MWETVKHHRWTTESLAIMRVGWPVMATFILQYFLQLVNMFVIGHAPGMEERGLAAAALGNMYSNFTGIAVTLGMATAIDTLAAQAFGANNYRRVGVIVQRGAVYLTVLCLPVGILWWFGGGIMRHLKQDPETVDYAEDYVKISILGLWPLVMFEVAKKFLQVQNLTVPPMIAVGVGIVANAVLAYILVFHTTLGFYGAPLALALAEWIMFFAMMLYMWIYYDYVTEVYENSEESDIRGSGNPDKQNEGASFAIAGGDELFEDIEDVSQGTEDHEGWKNGTQEDDCSYNERIALNSKAKEEGVKSSEDDGSVEKVLSGRTWQGFSAREAFSGWKEFTLLALPGAIQLTIEWGTFEVLALISGMVGTTALATHSILSMSGGAMFMFPLGLSVAVGIRVGHAIGDQRPKDAKESTLIGYVLGIMYSILNGIVVIGCRKYWAFIFSSQESVVALTAKTLPVLAVFNLFDANQCVLSGVLRGVGRQALGATINFFSYCIIGLPVAYALALPEELGLSGVWGGATIGAATASVLLSLTVALQNWQRLSRQALHRSAATRKQEEDDEKRRKEEDS
eukprot:gb/GECG01002287.1/.p1 GENE.gb/GECG01002287.1/~~gb/GECG01002287.1/.p1  ORF type:complete len:569 (+),score=68.14 gb/GECG01002287.1/:1-1707(+)